MKLSAIQRFTMLDYPDRVACIAFTPGCNMRCGFCHNPEFVLPEKIAKIRESFIAEDTFFNFLEKRRGLLEGVVVSGGEPTIWEDLPEFFASIKRRDFLTKLDTNGNHPAMLRHLLDAKLVDYVALDVKTALAEYPTLVGHSMNPRHIEESIDALRASAVPYEFRTTLIKEIHTPRVLEAMKATLMGAQRYYLQTFRPSHTLNPVFATYHPFSAQEMEDLVRWFGGVSSQVALRA